MNASKLGTAVPRRVALVSMFTEERDGVPPLGPMYLATALKRNNIEAKIIHNRVGRDGDIEAEIEEFKPDLVGMSVFTGYLNGHYIQLSKRLKERGHSIVWGNAHASLVPRQVLSEASIDFVVIGEGEETLVELVQNLPSKERYPTIRGIGFKEEDGTIVINATRGFVNIDDYLIDWSLVDLEKYIVPYFSNRYKRVLSVVSSRGCPFNCQFCYNLVFNNRRWRGHDASRLVENLKPVIDKYKIDAIRFLDDNFFVDKKRAFAIAEGLGLPYFGDCRAEFVDEEFVIRARKTRCLELMFGFESGSDRILKDVVKKGTTTKEILNAVTLLKGSGIKAAGSFVFGLPTETEQEYRQTMRFTMELLEINPNLAFTCGWFLPYPGTGLYEKAKEMGFTPPNEISEWDRFDRWRNDYQMEWLSWDYKKAVKYSRKMVNILALTYRKNFPLFKQIMKWRTRNLNLLFPVDIFALNKLWRIHSLESEKNLINKGLARLMKRIMKGRGC